MIRNKSKLDKFHQKLIREEKLSHKEALSIYEALHKEAIYLGTINLANILEGLEIDLKKEIPKITSNKYKLQVLSKFYPRQYILNREHQS